MSFKKSSKPFLRRLRPLNVTFYGYDDPFLAFATSDLYKTLGNIFNHGNPILPFTVPDMPKMAFFYGVSSFISYISPVNQCKTLQPATCSVCVTLQPAAGLVCSTTYSGCYSQTACSYCNSCINFGRAEYTDHVTRHVSWHHSRSLRSFIISRLNHTHTCVVM